MRILIVIASDLYLRSFVETGAFSALESEDVAYVAGDSVSRVGTLEAAARVSGVVGITDERERRFGTFRRHEMTAMRSRSETMRIKTELDMGPRRRAAHKAAAAPGVRGPVRSLLLARAGRNDELKRLIESERPDLIVAPTAGTDALVWDAITEGRRAGIPSFALINGWDNLSSKAAFPALPEYMGVWSNQQADHAVEIHGMARERTFVLGVPTFEHHFGFDPSVQTSPYPFPFVLFAGCALPFDELSALTVLDDAVSARAGDDAQVVYRPHPWRHPRRSPDRFDPDDFERVVLDRQLESAYALSVARGSVGPEEVLPALDYYPALLGHAELVVCPLSTMIVESLIVGTRALVLTYDDGVHPMPPSTVARFTHFEGLERTDGISICSELDRLGADFADTLAAPEPIAGEPARRWLHFEPAPYSDRLRRAIDAIAAQRSQGFVPAT